MKLTFFNKFDALAAFETPKRKSRPKRKAEENTKSKIENKKLDSHSELFR
jgi:hypothetical protein